MKKILALALAAAMVFSLAACGGGGNGGGGGNDGGAADQGSASADVTPDEGGGAAVATPHANEDGSPNLDMIAYYDPNYDYSANETLRSAYITSASGPLYQEADEAYGIWSNMMNMQYLGMSSAEGDNDQYMTLLQNHLDQGVDILILDPDVTIWPSIQPILANYPDVQWMGMMASAVDADGQLIHPFCGFDHYVAGEMEMEKLFDWMNETYPDADWSTVGCIAMDYSLSPPLHQRVEAAQDYWAANAPAEAQNNLFLADCSSTGLSIQGGLDAASPVVSTNTNIQYWLIQGNIDDWAQGAVTAVESAGLGETSCGVTFGGAGLRSQWDAGTQNCWRYALNCATFLYAEPIIGACYAFAQGWATPDSIWPSWVNVNDHGGPDHTYSKMLLPTAWLDFDNYQQYYEWVDLYAGTNTYPYDVEVTLDAFPSTTTDVPEYYSVEQ
ncbi:MAG: hypothetical protein IJU67_02675 [Lachnospiraceae bacterium]|nr:hypothetical protein [Lachnospiraceae bacterium]